MRALEVPSCIGTTRFSSTNPDSAIQKRPNPGIPRNLLLTLIDSSLTGWKNRIGWSILCADYVIVSCLLATLRSSNNTE